MASRFIESPELLPDLLHITFRDEDPLSCKASWILDMVLREKQDLLLPHLDYFCQHLGKVNLDGVVRPLAKICEMLVLACLHQKKPGVFGKISDENLEAIATACFDWLISEQKVAPQAYSMTSLYYLGFQFPWIHGELRQVLEQNYSYGSAGYRARARKLLHKLNG
ncbi:MAG: adenylosuccinate lyase [Eudoraea sp.]|nr:adenylosuccinate lyase [Eudoraea sp.]